MSPTAAFEFEALIGGDSPLKEKNKIFQAYHLKRTTKFFLHRYYENNFKRIRKKRYVPRYQHVPHRSF